MSSECDLCGGLESHHLFTKRGWRLVRCDSCGLVRVDPMLALEQTEDLYAEAAGYHLERLGGPTRYTRWENERTEMLAALAGPPPRPEARLLDVGCSSGDFLVKARARGWEVQGIELAEHLAVFARVERGLPVEHASASAVVERFGAEAFDLITAWDVIEHLPNPAQTMRALYRALAPGGTLYLTTPNLAGWVPRFHWRVLRPFGVWPHPEPPLHLYQFTRETIGRLFAGAGFEQVRFLPDEIPLWYTSGFKGEPGLLQWLFGDRRRHSAPLLYALTLPVFLAARRFDRGDSMIVCGSRPAGS